MVFLFEWIWSVLYYLLFYFCVCEILFLVIRSVTVPQPAMNKSKNMPNTLDDLAKKVTNLKVPSKEVKRLNILLLGETGAGKSTFINALVNYLTFPDLARAEKEKLQVLIPTAITVMDKNNEAHTIRVGEESKNENIQVGESATQDVKTYVFSIPNKGIEICLIDTPGMGDTRGICQDDNNCENILSYIANIHHLHAICFLFKTTQTRGTVLFKYCISQILSRLDKSANKNIIFVFTNAKASDYGPGETMPLLRDAVKYIEEHPPHVIIPFNKNLFCFENEAFRYLAAVQKNIEFSDQQKRSYRESWKKSVEQCNSMIEYINKLDPHFVKHTNAINEVRRAILQLAKPLADVTQLINRNMNILSRHEQNLSADNVDIEELKKKLYMPQVELDLERITQPITVCSKKGCAEIYKVSGENIYHYKQKCHNPCYLNNVPKEIVGDPGLQNCACIDRNTGNCTLCGCSFRLHLHIYYLTRTKEVQKKSDYVSKQINDKEKVMDSVRKLIQDMRKRQGELDDEYKVIISCSARFAHFLQSNAITPINDYYKEYIVYLIEAEKFLGSACNKQTIQSLEKLINQYEMEKQIFANALKSGKSTDLLTPDMIQKCIRGLYTLKHNGPKIKELFDCQKTARKNEHKNTEYVHTRPVGFTEKTKNLNDEKVEKKNKKGNTDGNKKQQGQQKGPKSRGATGSPPPSYHETIRREGSQNNQPRPTHSGYYHPAPPLMPQYPPYYTPNSAGYHQQPPPPPPPPGPSAQHAYPPYNYPGQPHYPPPTTHNSTYEFREPGNSGDDRPTIQVTINRSNDGAKSAPTTPGHHPDPNYHHYGHPPPPPPPPPHAGHYGPPPPPSAYPPPPHGAHGGYAPYPYPGGYPPQPHYPMPYGYHHGVNRNRYNNQNQNQNKNFRGKNYKGRGAATGGITRKRQNKNTNKSKQNQNKQDSDSEDSDSSNN